MESRGSRDERERSDRYDTNNSSRIIRTAVFGNIIPCLNQLPPGICYHLLDLWDEFVSMPAGIVRLERPVTRSRYYYWCVSYMLNEIFGSVTPYLETTMERPMRNLTVEDGSNHDNDEDHEDVIVRVDGEGRDIDANDEVETEGVGSRVEENDGSKEDGHVRFYFWSDSFMRSVVPWPRDMNKEWVLSVSNVRRH
jgi:hypothetical protein